MRLTRLRAIGAGCCLVATAMMLPATTAQADAIPSQLATAPDLATARVALTDALALERLVGLGFKPADAERLVTMARVAQEEVSLNRSWVEQLGLPPREAALLTAELSDAEMAWMGRHPTEATTYAGKVVGMNWKALMILLLPLIIVAWVAGAGSGGGAEVAAGALVVGLLFVLIIEPAYIFGSDDDVMR